MFQTMPWWPVHVYSKKEKPPFIAAYINMLSFVRAAIYSLIFSHEGGNNLLRGTRYASQIAEK